MLLASVIILGKLIMAERVKSGSKYKNRSIGTCFLDNTFWFARTALLQ